MKFFSNETLESIGYNSPLFIIGGAMLSMLLFVGTRELIFHSFYEHEEIMLLYSFHRLGDIAGWFEVLSPYPFIIHGAIRFFGYGLFEDKEKLKAYLVIFNIALIAVAYIVYLYLIFKFLNNPI